MPPVRPRMRGAAVAARVEAVTLVCVLPGFFQSCCCRCLMTAGHPLPAVSSWLAGLRGAAPAGAARPFLPLLCRSFNIASALLSRPPSCAAAAAAAALRNAALPGTAAAPRWKLQAAASPVPRWQPSMQSCHTGRQAEGGHAGGAEEQHGLCCALLLLMASPLLLALLAPVRTAVAAPSQASSRVAAAWGSRAPQTTMQRAQALHPCALRQWWRALRRRLSQLHTAQERTQERVLGQLVDAPAAKWNREHSVEVHNAWAGCSALQPVDAPLRLVRRLHDFEMRGSCWCVHLASALLHCEVGGPLGFPGVSCY